MFRKTFCALLEAAGLMGLAGSAQAQFYVPHTSTHIDYVPHHGHYHVMPHATTHRHR